ncbi:AGAP005407-PA-like protein [Anopheles sinensis]|uniref:AGAP005407-PA-like protein n=1 Tax=Anopheles sinensis TaxID=74873 RepID=A0A084VDP3_ANOSI|nr:AGAP005407-PA-like protein [Anopheles sinensis]
MLLVRQENAKLRDMVRKLKDQLQIITGVMISVRDQSAKMFDTINRPHSLAEEYERNREPRASEVYERLRSENPPCVHEAVIYEEEEEEEVDESRIRSSSLEESLTPHAFKEHVVSGCGSLLLASPLVKRLKRPSKNDSFDESFETIERERVFKASRISGNRRQIYGGLPEEPDSLREMGSDVMEADRPSTGTPIAHKLSPDESSDMEIEDNIRETLKNISPISMDAEEFQPEQSEHLRYKLCSDGQRGVLKKTASESMLSTLYRCTSKVEQDCKSGDSSFEDTSEFQPEDTISNASCSTPVTKGTRVPKVSSISTRPLRAVEKMKSDTALNKQLEPVVVLRPLTEQNVLSFTRASHRGRTGRTDTKPNDNCPGSSNFNGTTLEPSSSTENLSVASNESGRPRRKAAPKTLKEPSLNSKMRREK